MLLLAQRAAAQAGPLLVAFTLDRAVPAWRAGDHGPVLAAAMTWLLCALAAGGLQYAFVRLSARVGQNVLFDLRHRVFEHAQLLGADFHQRYTSGRVVSRATSDVDALRAVLEDGLPQIVGATVSTAYITAMLLYLDWGLGLAALVGAGPLYLTARSFRRRSIRVYRESSTAIAAVTGKLTETLAGIRTIQAFGREDAGDTAFAAVNDRHQRAVAATDLEMARYVVTSRLVAGVAVAAVVLWGAHRVAAGTLSLGVLAAAALYLRRLYDDPLRLGGVLDSYQAAAASLEKIVELLSHQPAVPEPRAPKALPPLPGASGTTGRQVTFKHVRFAYRTGGDVLPHLDLTIPAGQTVAVTGPTGAGKTTLAKLAARLHDPTDGHILLDGVDLRDLTTADLRDAVAMVTQEPFLFSGTLADNIALGRPQAPRTDIEQAARATGAHDFITALPNGYDTDLNQQGRHLSAGQRQLISLTRALLADPPVLILDEAISSLDLPTERAVHQAMTRLLHGRTTIVIAHRPATVSIADRVLVLVDGHITEDGPLQQPHPGRSNQTSP
ncbi:ABC transporter ATP-binding protein [Spirillospora sp. CA-255316]